MRRGATTQRAMGGLMAVGFVVGLGAVAGCSGDPGPTPVPSVTEEVTPSPTPTPTPTPTPDASVKPERPEAMNTADSAGAEAAAVYFLQLFPYIFATGDLEDYRALSHPECIYCTNVIAGVQEIIAAGQHSVGGLEQISDVVVSEPEAGRWWLVQLTLVEQPSTTLDATGEVVEEFPDVKTYRTDIAVIWEADHWSIREVTHTRQNP